MGRPISEKLRCYRWQGKCSNRSYLMAGNPQEQFSAVVERLEVRETRTADRLERRKRTRSQVHWPVCFFGVDTEHTVETVTQNLSSSGFRCILPVPLALGDLMICVLRVPSYQHSNHGRASSLECKIRIVRVEPADGPKSFGIACQIEDYRFVESNYLI